MELIVQEIAKPQPIQFNYEELKAELTTRVADYKTVVYTANNIREAKADRAKLNALKKSLNDERLRLEKEYMEPFTVFKAQVTDLVMIVDDAAKAIDKQVKDYEDLQKKEKAEGIAALFDSIVSPEIPWLDLQQIWNEKWLNATCKVKQIETDFANAVSRIKSDMEMLGRLPEYSFEAQENYKKTLDVNGAIRQADYLKSLADAKAAAEEAARHTTMNEETVKQDEPIVYMPEPSEPNTGDSERREWVSFRAYLSMDEAVALNKFMKTNQIKFEQIR